MRHVIWWLGMVIVFALITASFNWRGYRRLAMHGVRTQGVVTAVLPHDHATARYQYQVGGRTLEGQFPPWPPNPPLERLRVGHAVVVYYDPTAPGYSVLGDPKPILENETVAVTIGPLYLATFGMLARFIGSRLRRAPSMLWRTWRMIS